MSAERTGAYIAPHLRKKRPAAPTEPKVESKTESKVELKVEPRADVRLGDFRGIMGIGASPPASGKSQLSKPAQSQVSP